jgi:hypothetical protein
MTSVLAAGIKLWRVYNSALSLESRRWRAYARWVGSVPGIMPIEVKIQFENIHSRLSQEPELAALSMRVHKAPQLIFAYTAILSHAR